MNPLFALLAVIFGYLIGAISASRLVLGVAAPKEDMSETPITLPGTEVTLTVDFVSATTVSMHAGPKLGFLTFLLDMAKGAVLTLIPRLLWPDQPYYVFAAIAGMIGHVWPIYYRFRGGRGLSVVYGTVLVLDPLGFLVVSIGGLLFGLIVLRDFMLSYMAGLWLLIPWLWFRTHDPYLLGYTIAANLIYGIAYIPEFRKLIKYTQTFSAAGISRNRILIAELKLTGMGRGILKLAQRLNLLKEDQPKSAATADTP